MKTEPKWKIEPKHYDSFRGGNTYGLDEQNTLWMVAYVTQSWVDFLVDFDGNADGVQVGDFDGSPVGEVWDADNILTAVDEAELEAAALLAEAKQEFGF